MATLAVQVTNSIWHAFNALDDQNSGQVAKSKLKVLTANLGTLLQCLNVEKGLHDHRSTPYLRFEDYFFYLNKELFSTSPCALETNDLRKYQEQVEEVCWLVCRKQLLKRDPQVLPDACIYQLFRIFCLLAELVPCPQQIVQVVLPAEEVAFIAQSFVLALGRDWDQNDFEQIAQVIPTFKFPVFLALLETRYAQNVESAGLKEAIQELNDMFIKDVIKKGFLSKKGQFLPTWKEAWFVLQPCSLNYYSSRTERDKRGEISLDPKCTIESFQENSSARPNRFAIVCQDKTFEMIATDHKTKLQWILAIQTAIEHSGLKESYQKRQAIRRKAEREAVVQRRKDEAQQLIRQQQLLDKQQEELEAEKLARQAAEQQAQEQSALREAEAERYKELEEGKLQLERLLEEERLAKRDEEIVRNLQARVLREEWEKREELERLRDEQSGLLEEERTKRVGLEVQTQENGKQLQDALKRLKQLEEERYRIDQQLKEAQDKMIIAERAKEVLEAKLKVRERSFIPVLVNKSNSSSKLSSPGDNNKKKLFEGNYKRDKNQLPSDGEDED